MCLVRVETRHFFKQVLQNTRFFTILQCVNVVNITYPASLFDRILKYKYLNNFELRMITFALFCVTCDFLKAHLRVEG